MSCVPRPMSLIPASQSDASSKSKSSPTRSPRITPCLPNDPAIQVSVHAEDVKNVLRTYSIEVNASSKDDLKEVRALRPVVSIRLITRQIR